MSENSSSAAPVVVTRPLAQARALERKIAAIGREAIVFPLLQIHPLNDTRHLDAALSMLDQYALVAFVSPNAIDAAFARRPDWPRDVPLAVMGEGSRLALAAHGIDASTTPIRQPRDPLRTDSQTLLEALDLAALAGREVLILRGENGRELLAEGLRAAGVGVTQVAAYRRSAPQPDAATLEQLRRLLARGCDWLITSSEALRILLGLAAALDTDGGEAGRHVGLLQQQRLIVPHWRIEESARALGFRKVVRSGSGDESLLAALQFRDE